MTLWAAKWIIENALDGRSERILYEHCLPRLFTTRDACRCWIAEKYGYIADRPDLKTEPHGWRLPKAVEVTVKVTEAERVAARTPKRGLGE